MLGSAESRMSHAVALQGHIVSAYLHLHRFLSQTEQYMQCKSKEHGHRHCVFWVFIIFCHYAQM